MNRYSITTYAQAIDAIRSNGYLFNVGQIAQNVLTQLFMATREGILKVSQDSWPIRGCGQGSGEWEMVFEQIAEMSKDR